MDIRGHRTLDAPRDAVFAAICDPTTLLAVIPGCREIEQVGETEYRGQISLRLPGVVGTYRTIVRLVDADPPGYGRLEGDVTGSLGSIRGDATFRLTETDGRTTVDYDGRATIDGPLARLDSRFIEGLAGSLISQGLGTLEARLVADRAALAGASRPPRGRPRHDRPELSPAAIRAGGARAARRPWSLAAGHGGRDRRHAAHQRGDLTPRGGDGAAPGGPRPTRARRRHAPHRRHRDADPAARAGRRPDAPRGGPQHRQLVDPEHGHGRRQPVHATAGRRCRGRPAGPRRERDPGEHEGRPGPSAGRLLHRLHDQPARR